MTKSKQTDHSETTMIILCVIVSGLLCVALGAPLVSNSKPRLDGRIVGGFPVEIEEVNYQISLLYFGSHRCGGSLVSTTHVITAAHCTDGISATALSIRAGSTYRTSGGILIDIYSVSQHPQYQSITIDYDISVLTLESPVSLSSAIGLATLPPHDEFIPPGAESVVSGWGTLTEGGSAPQVLQAVVVPVVSQKECRAAYGQYDITERMMCAGVPEGGRDACQGDSGGPLVIERVLYGIVSWGYGCARPRYPGVYASVPSLRNYITSITGF